MPSRRTLLASMARGLSDAEFRKIRLAYKNMRQRCYNRNSGQYGNYGGRGIKVCPEWLASEASFVRWAKKNGHAMNLSLDRVKNDGDYSPGNCRWTDIVTQLRNQRRNHRISLNGRTMTASEWAEKLGIRQDTLSRRIRRYGVAPKRALTSGRLNQWRHGTRAGYEAHDCRCVECRSSNARHHRARRARRKVNRTKLAADQVKPA
jgi:hypothetical protein